MIRPCAPPALAVQAHVIEPQGHLPTRCPRCVRAARALLVLLAEMLAIGARAAVLLAACAAPSSASRPTRATAAPPPPSPRSLRPGGGAPRVNALNASTGSDRLPDAPRGRALSSVTVSSFADLASAVSGSATEIRLDAGTYAVTSTLSISSDVTITADVEGAAVVLDGQGSTRVIYISAATVQLVGLDITNGYYSSVRLLAA